MDAKIINPFLTSAIEVLKSMAFVDAKIKSKPYLKKERAAKGDVSSIVGVTGHNRGSFSISFEESCILKIVSNMFGEEIKELGEDFLTKVVGYGTSANLHEWKEERLIKLFWPNTPDEPIQRELTFSTLAHELGVPTPAVFGI